MAAEKIIQCPVCGTTKFGTHNGRENAGCKGCYSLERGRLQYIILRHLGLLIPGLRILHFAPERFLFNTFTKLCGTLYHPCDFDATLPNYAKLSGKVYNFDMCRDLQRMPSDLFDLIIHNHVLEHVPCDLEDVLKEHIRVLKPGGHLVFSVPFRGPTTDEDYTSELSPEERRIRFAQHDHVRIFGTKDFPEYLRNIFGCEMLFPVLDHWTSEELEGWGIPSWAAKGPSGVSNFVFKRPPQSKPLSVAANSR